MPQLIQALKRHDTGEVSKLRRKQFGQYAIITKTSLRLDLPTPIRSRICTRLVTCHTSLKQAAILVTVLHLFGEPIFSRLDLAESRQMYNRYVSCFASLRVLDIGADARVKPAPPSVSPRDGLQNQVQSSTRRSNQDKRASNGPVGLVQPSI